MVFCALAEEAIGAVRPLEEYFRKPDLLPKSDSARWFILDCIRQFVRDGKADGFKPQVAQSLPAQPVVRASADAADRYGREMGIPRR